MRVFGLIALGFLAACASAPATGEAPAVRSLGEILEQSPAGDWRTVDQNNLLYMQLPSGRVIIELAADYTPLHTANIRALARAHYWDGAQIVRSQENYVVQWGRDENDPKPMGEATPTLAPEFDIARADVQITRLPDPDSYAREVGFAHGFPVASNGRRTWMAHCTGMVGAGRVLQGMELLSTMPRGTGPLGFYETPAERTTITSVRLGSELPASVRVNLEALRTDSATFRDVIESRRFRRESWFLDPVGHINLCNVPLPVRVRS